MIRRGCWIFVIGLLGLAQGDRHVWSQDAGPSSSALWSAQTPDQWASPSLLSQDNAESPLPVGPASLELSQLETEDQAGTPEAPWLQSFLNLDAYEQRAAPVAVEVSDSYAGDGYVTVSDPWRWQVIPDGIIYRSYLAGVKEPRMQSFMTYIDGQGWFWEPTLGGRVALVRFGDHNSFRPQGIQLDAEGAAQARLNIEDDVNVTSVDFRGGLPLTFGYGRHATKIAYYHLSSHLGDEFVINNPGFPRLNYARDVIVLGHSIYLGDRTRVYAEAGWAFTTDVAKEWEFQFGLDYAPLVPTGFRGAPYFAINTHLREDVNYGGNLTAQVGWAWVGNTNAEMLRLGLQYYNGKSSQYSFFNDFEQQYSLGLWYDF